MVLPNGQKNNLSFGWHPGVSCWTLRKSTTAGCLAASYQLASCNNLHLRDSCSVVQKNSPTKKNHQKFQQFPKLAKTPRWGSPQLPRHCPISAPKRRIGTGIREDVIHAFLGGKLRWDQRGGTSDDTPRVKVLGNFRQKIHQVLRDSWLILETHTRKRKKD